ncbi:hypothetical protein SEA_GARDENSTATE_61 [Microbacterium phage GardenState]|uniref:Uncharacterized protein n=1 Tax=Microbacterium phage GardenState TaxID=2776841 RepID=A0A7L8ZEP7_9CAUD|nr:hypothetical protein SEA_GARDENSTATE_61 [Microbacterium phage GardenState]
MSYTRTTADLFDLDLARERMDAAYQAKGLAARAVAHSTNVLRSKKEELRAIEGLGLPDDVVEAVRDKVRASRDILAQRRASFRRADARLRRAEAYYLRLESAQISRAA